MAKRILITCTDSMMKQFLEPHVVNLVEHGYEVEIACSEVLGRFEEVQEDLGQLVKIHRVSLQRSPLALSAHMKGYKELKRIVNQGHFDLIWTNEPVMGVVTRLAAQQARRRGTKVLYMVHGFHFYKGAPIPNWMLFYPIERFMASKTDVLCTINREDFARGQKMGFPRVEYIHGVGINTNRLQPSEKQHSIREELGLPEDAFLVLSVGELNKNKNQQVIICALAELKDSNIHYVLCGKGDQREALEQLAAQLGVEEQVHFLGYRTDLADMYRQADVFAMPSKREGLPVAALEAMYCGLPLITSRVRGLSDVMEDGVAGFVCEDDPAAYAQALCKEKEERPQLRSNCHSIEIVTPYLYSNTKQEVLYIIDSIL